MFQKNLLTVSLLLLVIIATGQNDVGIGTSNPAARLDVQGNGIGYDVLRVANDKDAVPDSILILSKRGHLGVGIVSPQEKLHLAPLDGAIVLGSYVSPVGSEVAGTIEFNGTKFVGWTGPSSPVFLDFQADGDWISQPSAGSTPPGHNEWVVGLPSSLALSIPGAPNPGGWMWISDYPHPTPMNIFYSQHLILESTTNLLSDASMLFRMSDWTQFAGGGNIVIHDDYSVGVYRSDMTFKIFRGATLGSSAQGDMNTMLRIHPSGIIDLNNQSRSRGYQSQSTPPQAIPSGIWTPINFDMDVPLAIGYDEQLELAPATSPSTYIPPLYYNNPQAFFTAFEEGYYQVNARTEFDVLNYEIIPNDTLLDGSVGQVIPWLDSYVSISIWVYDNASGLHYMYAQGNNLTIANNIIMFYPGGLEGSQALVNNNAPNVSDVVYLKAGDQVYICVYHNALTYMNLKLGPAKTYVSIHKSS